MRSAAGETEHVLVVGGVSGLATGVRRGRRRRKRARPAGTGEPAVPITRLTVIRPGGFAADEEAERWLGEMSATPDAADEPVAEALAIVNRALHAHRIATQDPALGGVSQRQALATRIGFGTGDDLADGRWTEAVDVPPATGPRDRAEAMRPQERMAADLGRRQPADACETLLLRARADVDGERPREAALQLRVGLEALLAEVSAEAPPRQKGPGGDVAAGHAERQVEDLAWLEERRSPTGAAANEALRGELSEERGAEVAETLAVCERVLRRRRILAR